jgi:2-polyprenyl-3-methyl-5-hydroxy-6-metoxy-1,4-benzoquinol methylase
MEQKLLDFVIGTHAQNDVHGGTALSVQRLHNRGWKFYWDIRGAGGAARTRNIVCTHFLDQHPSDYLIFIDRDIVFEPNDVQLILNDLKENKLVGGCYAVKDGSQLSSYGAEGHGGITLDGKVREVLWLASGYMGIHWQLLRDMVDKLELPRMHKGNWSEAYPFFSQREFFDGNEWIWLTEDYEFCDKARRAGSKPYIDTRVQVQHIGDYSYTVTGVVEKSVQNRKERCIKLEKERLRHLTEDLSEYTGKTQEDVIVEIASVVKKLKEAWFEHLKNGETTEDFYRENELYLWDEADLQRQGGFWKNRMGELVGIRDSHVLDIGSGNGTTAFMLTHNNNKVVGFDINQVMVDFSNWRKDKYDVKNVEFTTELPVERLHEFDWVISVDTLEHIENLEPLIATLGKNLKRGARLLHLSEFGRQEISPMHFDHSKVLPKLLKKAGFLEWNLQSYVRR